MFKRTTKFSAVWCLLIPFIGNVQGQSSNIPLNDDYYHLIDRYTIKNKDFASEIFSTIKPYQRESIHSLLDSTDINGEVDLFNSGYLKDDSWEFFEEHEAKSKKPFLKHLYKAPSDFYYVSTKDFDLHLNPVLYFSYGGVTDDNRNPYINTRGIELRGMIDEKVGFYSFLGENQLRLPIFVRDWVNRNNTVPHEGFWKTFKNDGYDFFTARGYISFNATKHINFQFGHDQHFWGNGYRSLMLSDFSPAFLFLKINTKVWRLNYTNLFTQMKADNKLPGDEKIPNKYVTMHHLGINITDNFNLGLFEAVTFGNEDSTGSAGFELSYLNPIIFYRAIEQSNGSIDNAMIGLDFLWNFAHRFSAYGQLIIDELKVDEATSGDGWWGNKFAWQLGIKYIDAFKISNLDLQLEYNSIRPYIYSHRSEFTNYAHYRQTLAHPIGANLRELVGIIRYQPFKKLSLSGKIIITSYGEDSTATTNYGRDFMKKDDTREMEFGNKIAQGLETNLSYFDFTSSYMLRHNLFIDGSIIYRNLDSQLIAIDTDNIYVSMSLRLNIRKRLHEF